MNTKIRAFAMFWYDFVVGDDWTVALAVVVALALTAALSHANVTSWWVLPLAVTILLPVSLWRATRPTRMAPPAPPPK